MNTVSKMSDIIFVSLKNGMERQSKLTQDALTIPGFTSLNIRNFLNNICEEEGINYLEIGTHRGATIFSAAWENKGSFYGIDNFSEFISETGKTEFYERKSLLKEFADITFLEGDCWNEETIKQIPGDINIYFYDGAHRYADQYNALVKYYDKLASDFIFIVDDWNVGEIRKGTQDAIFDLKTKVYLKIELFTDKNGDNESWWNGLGIFVLSKKED